MIIWLQKFINKKICKNLRIPQMGEVLWVCIYIYLLVWWYIFLTCSEFLRCHPKDITNVAFHRTYPLFASCSDDCTAYVFHGTVYSDLNQNPLVVPLEILRGHASSNGRGESFVFVIVICCIVGRRWKENILFLPYITHDVRVMWVVCS